MASFLKEILYCLVSVIFLATKNAQCADPELDALALKNLITYLQIPSVHPNISYDGCVTFLENVAKSLDLPIKILEIHPKNPIVILTWQGTEPEKPSILLNGHMDVVPVVANEWTYPPFSAHIDEKGNIYARGVQDMKSLSIQQVEAVRRLKLNGTQLKRTVHISFVPGEEIGGVYGMKAFTESQEFKDMNIGFELDEGLANEGKEFFIFGAEKRKLQIWVHCLGKPGHGSNLPDDTAGEKLRHVIDRFLDLRASEKKKLEEDPTKDVGNVTTINLTMLRGGSQINVLPNELSAAFDMRLPPGVSHTDFKNMIEGWFKEIGEGISYTIEGEDHSTESTRLDDSNKYWLALKKACDDNGVKLQMKIMQGTTDARYLRALGIPALGFAPINNTPKLAHANDEYLNKDVFLKGIDIFTYIIEAVANV